jgi:hypothetical protein
MKCIFFSMWVTVWLSARIMLRGVICFGIFVVFFGILVMLVILTVYLKLLTRYYLIVFPHFCSTSEQVNLDCPQGILLGQIWHMFSQPMLHATISIFVQLYHYSMCYSMARLEHYIYCASPGYLSVISYGTFSDAPQIREVFWFCACIKIMISVSLSKNTKKKMRSFASHVDFNAGVLVSP